MRTVKSKDKYLDINGLRLHYLDWGTRGNQPILLLHGLMGHAHVWDAFALAFRTHYHVIALDQRGHGDSQWSPEAAYSMDDHVSDIARFVEKLSLNDLVLIGHSMGGRNALFYAVCVPERVCSLVMVDSRPGNSAKSREALTQLLMDFPLKAYSIDRVAESIQKLYHYVPSNTAYHVAKYGYRRSKRWGYVPKFDTRINQQCKKANYCAENMWSLLKMVPCPTLVIRGEESLFLSLDDAKIMCETISRALFCEIPHSTHMPAQENFDAFEKAVSDFLNIH